MPDDPNGASEIKQSPHDVTDNSAKLRPAAVAKRSSSSVLLSRFFSWSPSATLASRVDFVNKCLQIGAICLGAIWAFFVFIETVVPSLEPKLNVTGDITWTPTEDTNVCEGHFSLSVKNPGPGTLDVSSTDVKIWTRDLTGVNTESGSLVLGPRIDASTALAKNLMTGEEGSPSERATVLASHDIEPLTLDIVGHYPQNVENSTSQIFFFTKKVNTFAFIRVVLHGEGYVLYPFWKKPVDNWGYVMDRVCGAPKKQEPESKPAG